MGGWRCLTRIVADYVCGVGRAQLIRTIAWVVQHAVLVDDLLRGVDDECSIVELICDDGVPVSETNCIGREWTWVAGRVGVCEVFRYNRGWSCRRDFYDACVAGVGDEGVAVGQSACECSQ